MQHLALYNRVYETVIPGPPVPESRLAGTVTQVEGSGCGARGQRGALTVTVTVWAGANTMTISKNPVLIIS